MASLRNVAWGAFFCIGGMGGIGKFGVPYAKPNAIWALDWLIAKTDRNLLKVTKYSKRRTNSRMAVNRLLLLPLTEIPCATAVRGSYDPAPVLPLAYLLRSP